MNSAGDHTAFRTARPQVQAQESAATWLRYGRDADGDGYADPDDAADAIYSAAAYLRAAGAPQDMRGALFASNHAGWYVEEVLAWARRYVDATEAPGDAPSADEAGPVCALGPTASSGEVQIAPGADLPGRPINPETMAFLQHPGRHLRAPADRHHRHQPLPLHGRRPRVRPRRRPRRRHRHGRQRRRRRLARRRPGSWPPA